MKPWLILIVLAVAAMVAASAALPLLGNNSTGAPPNFPAVVDSNKDVPEVVVDGDLKYPFGVMALQTNGKHTWTFHNHGKAPLELFNQGTDCSCTVLQLGKDASTATKVPPGGSLAIDMTWTPKTNGAFRKSANIGTNDPRQPKVVLTIEGKVYPAVVVLPSNDNNSGLSFGPVGNEEDVIRPIVLYSKDRPELKVLKVVSSVPDRFAVSVRPATKAETNDESETGHAVDVTLKASDKLGSVVGEVLIVTDHPEKPELKIRVSAQVTGPVSFIPSRAEVRNATTSDGGSAVNRVWVRGRTETHFTMVAAPPGVSVEFEPMPANPGVAGSMFRMTTRIAPGTPAGEIQGTIVLRTDNPHAAEIRLPVEALVQEKH